MQFTLKNVPADEQQKCCPKDDSGNFLSFRNPFTYENYLLECVEEEPQVDNDLCTSMVYVADELHRDVREFIAKDTSLYHNLKNCKASLVMNQEEIIKMMPIQEFIQHFKRTSYRPTMSGAVDYQKVTYYSFLLI